MDLPGLSKEPMGFRALAWGSSKESLTNMYNVSCGTVGTDPACDGEVTIGGIRADVRYFFPNLALSGVVLRFPANRYDFMHAVFIEKYGTATSVDHEPVQNGFGATFDNETTTWRFHGAQVRLVRFGSNLTESTAIVGLNTWADALVAAQETAHKKAAKDF